MNIYILKIEKIWKKYIDYIKKLKIIHILIRVIQIMVRKLGIKLKDNWIKRKNINIRSLWIINSMLELEAKTRSNTLDYKC